MFSGMWNDIRALEKDGEKVKFYIRLEMKIKELEKKIKNIENHLKTISIYMTTDD